jgi:hypothetical protein
VNRPVVLFTAAALSASGLAALVSACSSDSLSPASEADASTDGPLDTRRALPGDDAAAFGDAGAEASICELTRAYTIRCSAGSDGGDPLTCGAAKFDAWCAKNDKAINSDAYRRAEALCLVKKSCDGFDRRDCEYRSYATAKQTAAQKQVVAAYCQTCEPKDVAGCMTRKTDYDPALGPKSTDDVFVAAWELNDTLDDAIRTKCTGAALDAGIAAALDAGGDAAPCLKAFGSCAGDIYVSALPDCPP